MNAKVAKLLEIGPYPPPMAGWSIRIKLVREKLQAMGHVCKVLNLGVSRRTPSVEYITVRNGPDYLLKTLLFAVRGYTLHMHTNGDGTVGLLLSLVAAIAGCICGRRIVLSFHAGTHQKYFPRERSGLHYPLIYLLFKLSKVIICNNERVKERVVEYSVPPDKVVPIRAFCSEYVLNHDVELPTPVAQFLKRHDLVVFTYAPIREGYYWDTLVGGIRLLFDQQPSLALLVAGSLEDSDPALKRKVLSAVDASGLTDRVCFAGDLTHDQFLAAMRRSMIYLRTPTTDGECSSVLEALTLRVPVVAAENNNRPTSVQTYVADSPVDMSERLGKVLSNHNAVREQIDIPMAKDTITEEAELLIATHFGSW